MPSRLTACALLSRAALLTATLVTAAPARADDAISTDPAKIKAGTYELEAPHGKITWSINHLGFSTYIGQFSDVEARLTIDPAQPANTQLKATIKTASVGTLNPKLDAHLKSADFFNVAKFPTATFESTKVETTGASTAHVTGNLTIMGVTKPEVLDVTFNQSGSNPVDHKYEVGFTGTTTVKRSEFGLTKYLPVLGNEVALQLEGEFTQPETGKK